LNEPLNIVDYHEHALGSGKEAKAITLIAIDDERGPCYGAVVSRNTITASLTAVIAALNRRWKNG
ncbi:MAG: alpha-isopropylmalate synthase regulatory domain-containing protein, partial [Gammaproteobacteria bacterium]